MSEVSESYSWQIKHWTSRTVPYGSGWREWLATKLLKIVDRLDRRRMILVIEAKSSPAISGKEYGACIRAGIKATERALDQAVQTEARERLFRKTHIHLFEEPGCK